ncbi:hypothetical protein B296_00012017 [Ensete ventricosum]|uniref:Nrap protein domain-containing protein n=1 Tax=Ensete ventricosum TaxID=4639 RepID=A0A427APH3_ENSVE|nr:hypothetical protein B296_00012017 [Ensete ventricosum]
MGRRTGWGSGRLVARPRGPDQTPGKSGANYQRSGLSEAAHFVLMFSGGGVSPGSLSKLQYHPWVWEGLTGVERYCDIDDPPSSAKCCGCSTASRESAQWEREITSEPLGATPRASLLYLYVVDQSSLDLIILLTFSVNLFNIVGSTDNCSCCRLRVASALLSCDSLSLSSFRKPHPRRSRHLEDEVVVEMDSLDFKVGELLKEIVLDDSAIEILDRAVSSVVDAIESIPEQLVSADAAPKFVADLGVPTDKKVSFTFKSPESIQVGGSYSIRSVAKPDINVDLLVRMPKECFHEKDYLNHRYHAKRLLYLRVVEKSLTTCPVIRKIGWSSFQNEARKPVLIVFPALSYYSFLSSATSNLMGKSLCLQPRGQCNISKEVCGFYSCLFSVFCLNLLFFWSLLESTLPCLVFQLQDEVSWTLSSIDKCRGGGFEEVFLTKVDFAAKFDSCLR